VPETIEHIRGTASLLAPEIVLLTAVCVLFLAGPFTVSDAGEAPAGLRHRWGIISLFAIAVAWFAWYHGGSEPVKVNLFQLDALVWFIRGLTLSAGLLLALVLWNQIDDAHAAEAHACLLSILCGTNLVAAANDLVSLFLALELVSIPTYVLLYLPRRDRLGGEATLKYFLLSVLSSALVLYGMSWLYGVAGSTNFAAIQDSLQPNASSQVGAGMLEIAFALLVAGLSFRIAAVPFHFYAPDVFEGTTAANAALLSIAPKIVGFVALMRLIPLSAPEWVLGDADEHLLAVLAVATMFLGNLLALRQKHLYRLMAYSSIAHAGYMLIGLAIGNVGPVGGRDAILFYLAAYALMTIGVFALMSSGNDADRSLQTADDLRGLSRTQPQIALLLAICLFSLTGLPLTAGFLGKLNLFLAAWSDQNEIGPWLAILMALNAAIGAYYYLRLVALMYLEAAAPGETKPVRTQWAPWLAGIICAVLSVAIFFAPQWLWDSIR
jgi:NADH-quinone oxidoreductase subunit N